MTTLTKTYTRNQYLLRSFTMWVLIAITSVGAIAMFAITTAAVMPHIENQILGTIFGLAGFAFVGWVIVISTMTVPRLFGIDDSFIVDHGEYTVTHTEIGQHEVRLVSPK